jgi:hypothetical protein
MKLQELETLVAQGESENLEFKSSTGSLSSGMQTVCAKESFDCKCFLCVW